ncbi:MAG: ATP-binding protein [Chitinophagales bacterium]|nr:ATP-binding protein [Chitinophagales bacterium]
MESANNIFFFDRSSGNTLPDAKVLEFALQFADVGVLVLNKQNEILYSNDFFYAVTRHIGLKKKLQALFAFETVSEENETTQFVLNNEKLIIQTALVKWQNEAAALFLLRKERIAKSTSAELHLAEVIVQNIQLPVLLFKNNLLVTANSLAIDLLSIKTEDFKSSCFEFFFEGTKKNNSKKSVESIFQTKYLQIALGKNKTKHDIVSSNILLDEEQFCIVQILPENIAKENLEHNSSKFNSHDLITMASHDLREPVRTIANFSHLTIDKLKKGKNKQALEYAVITNNAALGMDKLLSDLKLLIEINDSAVEAQKVNAEAAAKAAVAEVSKLYNSKLFEVKMHGLSEVKANEKLLIKLFIILLDNAIKFKREEKSTIQIIGEKHNEKVLLCVKDNGIGISRKHHKKVFEPFERLNRVDVYPGNGLGLAIAKKIIEKLHGEISIESILHGGTSVYIELPL